MSTSDLTIEAYLADLSARQSTPGGGAVASLTGAQAAGLIAMVGEFSDKTVDPASRELLLSSANAARDQFMELADLDAKKFAALMDCYRNKSGIQDGLKGAAEAPIACLELVVSLVPCIQKLEESGNQNLVTDTGIASWLLCATIEASEMNVRVNLRSIKDETFAAHAISTIEQARSHLPYLSEVAQKIIESLG